jgi:hypothetical protein
MPCKYRNISCFVVLVDDFAFLGPQGVLQVGKLKVLLLSMSVVLGDCCTTSLINWKNRIRKHQATARN